MIYFTFIHGHDDLILEASILLYVSVQMRPQEPRNNVHRSGKNVTFNSGFTSGNRYKFSNALANIRLRERDLPWKARHTKMVLGTRDVFSNVSVYYFCCNVGYTKCFTM